MSSAVMARPSAASVSQSSRTNTSNTPSTPPQPRGQPRGSSTTSAPLTMSKSSTPQPGTWSHPSLDEIARRQNAAVFNGDNVNRIMINAGLLVASIYLPAFVESYITTAISTLLASFYPITLYAAWAVRLLFTFNIASACRPLFSAKDEVEDIPLTPSQRALLGLKPSSAPLTPGQQYITPPRYARSSTPRSSANAQRLASGSPLSARAASPSSFENVSTMSQSKGPVGSPYSSSSPLMQKAIGGASAARRLSYGGSSPLDLSGSGSGNSLPSMSTTGLASGKASVGLNSKWLYERGRGSPGGTGLFA
ncbi:hypothetical protein AAFC00_000570 [Neodothiora populina]|uniref:Nuclear pore complex component n=1 Tax=Neodothiora populina TaxID=2781224 RepID=A0ABR3PDC1_9PEZI